MNSRYGFWFISICWISLAGCANWQSRIGGSSPGTAATMQPATVSAGAPVFGAPGASINEPPPPLAPPPSDPGASLAPLGAPSGQKVDLSSAAEDFDSEQTKPKVSSGRMYNLDTAAKSEKSGSETARKTSTISKLASKASNKTSAKETADVSATKSGALQKLSVDAAKSSKSKPEGEETANKADSQGIATTPPPTPGKAAEPAPSAAVDTTLLAQPVRKGSSDDKNTGKESKGPQSNLMPVPSLFDSKNKHSIYPVSNPVSEEPVDVLRFS